MSDTTAAIKAAREVGADTKAPEYFREARDWFTKARKEYKLKNFKEAKEFADKARYYAERAELEALKNGASRTSILPPDPTQLEEPKKDRSHEFEDPAAKKPYEEKESAAPPTE